MERRNGGLAIEIFQIPLQLAEVNAFEKLMISRDNIWTQIEEADLALVNNTIIVVYVTFVQTFVRYINIISEIVCKTKRCIDNTKIQSSRDAKCALTTGLSVKPR